MADGDKNEKTVEITDDKSTNTNANEQLQKLLEFGFAKPIAIKLDEVFQQGKLLLSDLDGRALDALKEYPLDAALAVIEQFASTNLEHVSNKSAYLCGVLKAFRQKNCLIQNVTQNLSTVALNSANSNASLSSGQNAENVANLRGPDELKIREILRRTGYKLDVSTGQRKYTGPPPGWSGSSPVVGCEVFCGRIPKDIFEDELIVLFEKYGVIWDLRLMMDSINGTNRGFAFVTYTTKTEAQKAVKELDNYEIRLGKNLKVNISVPNLRLFVGNIPKSKSKDDIFEEFRKLTSGLVDVIIYSSPDDKKKNRGFCFLEYESHKEASLAKRRLCTSRVKIWNCDIIVDWADPQEEPDEDTMSKVKVLYVRNLTQEITEDTLRDLFEAFGKIERVKKIKDYSFVHYFDRENAINAMRNLDGTEIGGAKIEVSLAKPPSDKKKKEEMLRARERRMMQMMLLRGGCMSNGTMFPQMIPGSLRGPWPFLWNAAATVAVSDDSGNGSGHYSHNRWPPFHWSQSEPTIPENSVISSATHVVATNTTDQTTSGANTNSHLDTNASSVVADSTTVAANNSTNHPIPNRTPHPPNNQFSSTSSYWNRMNRWQWNHNAYYRTHFNSNWSNGRFNKFSR